MGAGASSQYELTSQQKAEVARALQDKYSDLKTKSQEGPNAGDKSANEVELFESLKR
jgi:hypothetical protein